MKLAVPDMISNSYFPAIAAIELGLFKEEGLDVELELVYPVDKSYAAMRDGAVDFVGGSAHSALAAYPQWQGAKLLCAQAQGMYWFLVMHKDLGGKRGDLSVLKGRSIGAAPWVEMGLRRLLIEEVLQAPVASDGHLIVAERPRRDGDAGRVAVEGGELVPAGALLCRSHRSSMGR